MSQINQSELWNKMTGAASAAGATMQLLGEVVSWTMKGATTFDHLRAALTAAGLDPKVARPFVLKNAFARVCQILGDNRIIRPLRQTDEELHFQFTAESREGVTAPPAVLADGSTVAGAGGEGDARYSYRFETILSLHKSTGQVTCDKPELTESARLLLVEALEKRTANDVTHVIQRLFRQQEAEALEGDLWPIREEGAVYFVMASQTEFLSKIASLVESLGGVMSRFPIPVGTGTGNKTVQEVVSRGLGGLIREMEEHVAEFGDKTRGSTMDRAAAKIKRTQEKIDAYAAYLGEQQETLKAQLAGVRTKLKAKILLLAQEDEADECELGAAPAAPVATGSEEYAAADASEREPALV